MNFSDERIEQAWISLTQEKHLRFSKALDAAKEAAWRDLPTNERARYFDWAYQAVKKEERSN